MYLTGSSATGKIFHFMLWPISIYFYVSCCLKVLLLTDGKIINYVSENKCYILLYLNFQSKHLMNLWSLTIV